MATITRTVKLKRSLLQHPREIVMQSGSDTSLPSRLRLVIWAQHQPAIAIVLVACIVCLSGYFIHRSYVESGLIDIDRSGSLQAEFKVDINSADWGEIVVLPGVGEKLALAIVEYRETYGPFESLNGLNGVVGIGEKKLELLTPYLLPITPSPRATLPDRSASLSRD